MVEELLSPQAIARQAYYLFVPMLDEWRHQSHPEPSLATMIEDKCAAKVLEQDFRDIGIYLISSDNRGTRIELGVLVDCLTELRQHSTQTMEAVTQEKLEQEFEMVKHNNAGSSFLPPPTALNLPLCLRVVRDLRRMEINAEGDKLKDLLVEFVHRIVLQDGNVTANEIAVTNEIEEFLTDMMKNAA